MSESIFNWLKRAKAQPGTGNVPNDLPSGRAQRVADSMEAGPKTAAPAAPAAPSAPAVPGPVLTPEQQQQQDRIMKQGLRSDVSTGAAALAGSAMVPWNPVHAQRPGPVGSGPAVIDAQPTRQGLAQAKWGPAGSPEAQAFRASQAPAAETAVTQGSKAAGLRSAAGMAARGAGILGLGLSAGGAINEAANQTSDAMEGKFAATPENRPQRALNILKGALNPFGLFGGDEAKAAAPVAAPVQQEQSGSIPAPQDLRSQSMTVNPQEWQENKRGMDGSTKPAFLPNADGTSTQFEVPRGGMLIRDEQTGQTSAYKQSNPDVAIRNEVERMRAARDAENEVRNSFRSTPSSSSGLRMGGRFGGAFTALSKLQGYGAAGRLAKNEADLANKRAEVGLRGQAHALNAKKFGYDMAKDQRDFATKAEETAFKRRETEFEDWARQEAGPQDLTEGGPAYENRIKGKISEFRNEVNYTLGDTSGKKLGELKGAEMEQLKIAKKMKDKLVGGRSDTDQYLRDLFGNKRVDSKNLYSYLPVKAERATLPGSYVIHMKNGNTASVKALADGGFQWLGPNKPVDADIMALLKPHIQKAEKGK